MWTAVKSNGEGVTNDLPSDYCKHRWVNVKRWIDGETYKVIQKCRWCNKWQRVDLTSTDSGLTRKTIVENNEPQAAVKDVDSETGEVKP